MPANAVLTMMLLNEEENIERCLQSIEHLWSHFIIGFDNKMTDNTEALVRDWMKGREHLGVFHHYDWPRSFAVARNLHLDLALTHYPDCQFILSADGDDLLDPRARTIIQAILRDAPTQYKAIHSTVYLDPDEHGIPFIFYPRPVLLLNRRDVRYKGAAHNVIDVPEDEQLLVESLIVWHRQQPRKRAMRERQRIEENIPNLTKQAEDNPTDSRPWFYRGNTALDAGDHQSAEADYLHYLTMATWPNERYQVRLHLAAIRFTAGDVSGAQEHLWSAIRERGQFCRAEAYMHLADCALAQSQPLEAIHWLSIAGEIAPPVSSMFLNGAIYTYLPHWRLALLYDKFGAFRQALQHARRAYAWRPAPEYAAAIAALEATLADANSTDEPLAPLRSLDDGLSHTTEVLPLAEAELHRLIAEIPRWSPDGVEDRRDAQPEHAPAA